MKIKAETNFARISSSKVRPFARLLKGLPVADALRLTQFSPRKAAFLIGKTLKSAIANVEKNAKLAADDFSVEAVIIKQGPSMKCYWSRSRGMVRPVRKQMSHIRVVLSNE